MGRIKKVIIGVLLGISGLLSVMARGVPAFAQWYSTHIYPVWVNVTGRITGLFPCSVVEILLYLGIVVLAVTGGRAVLRSRKAEWFLNVCLLASVLLFLYVVNCGINYHRVSFSESTGIIAGEYDVDDLKAVCRWLTEEVNTYSAGVERDNGGVMTLGGRQETDVPAEAVRAMEDLGETYEELAGYYPGPKGLLFPWILSVQNLTGVYSPFTIEANYNSGVVDYNQPFTACHELSHLRGFMQEEEANFIAFLACREAEETAFRYSGNLMGWTYCMNVLYQADYDAWEELREELKPDVESDLRANSEFWAKYDGTVAEVASRVNDTYLKANGQEKGVKSYDHMVDLIVAYYGTFIDQTIE